MISEPTIYSNAACCGTQPQIFPYPALEKGLLIKSNANEMIPVSVPKRKGDSKIIDFDENPRANTTLKKLSKLRAVMGGVCTTGNTSTENDRAAAVVVTSEEKAAELDIELLAMMKSCAVGDDFRHT